MPRVTGYIRVSGTDQVLDLQRDALAAIRCDRVWEEVASGAKDDRPALLDLLGHLREGDTLVVWRLDRLGRSLKHLIETVEDLQRHGVAFRSLTESIDTSSAGGMLIFQIFGALAQFERTLIQERTAAGLAAARARGRIGGQPKRIDPAKARIISQMIGIGIPRTEIAMALGIGRATLYRHLAENEVAAI
ncbi:recombinase family protein [Rhodococcus globerulus]|uniref:Recombinase family protein n=1 Tax=Rhodococcus globerulus TaxID=33008 RepID=A0ABU4C5P1_RHOGO|nr:recombinase family protein [Rhodococcus globerulus]MDV6271508.1 recombinase family protein [Rhodococcus globerulus]